MFNPKLDGKKKSNSKKKNGLHYQRLCKHFYFPTKHTYYMIIYINSFKITFLYIFVVDLEDDASDTSGLNCI